ncbi:MAG: protein kinase [Azospirillum sp.]|nr:protein kinase [Azospirillum sp.]
MLLAGFGLQGYRIVRLIQAGRLASTYLAEEEALERLVLLKEFAPDGGIARHDGPSVRPVSLDAAAEFERLRRLFRDGARLAAQVDHPTVPRILHLFEANETEYLVHNYPPGDRLADLMAEKDQPLSDAEIRGLLMPLAEGIELLHDHGLVHGDLRAETIVVDPRHGLPVLLDFGSVAGDDPGAAAEAAALDELLPWTDIHALSAIGYRLIGGHLPGDDGEDRGSAFRIPPLARDIGRGRYGDDLLALIDLGLGLGPEERPNTVAEWRQLKGTARVAPAAPNPAPAPIPAPIPAPMPIAEPAPAPLPAATIQPEPPAAAAPAPWIAETAPAAAASAATGPAASPNSPPPSPADPEATASAPLLAAPEHSRGPVLSGAAPVKLPPWLIEAGRRVAERWPLWRDRFSDWTRRLVRMPLWSRLRAGVTGIDPAWRWQLTGAGIALVLVLAALGYRWTQAPWRTARALGSAAGYQHYLQLYPNGWHAEEARMLAEKQEANVRQRRRDAESRIEEFAWDAIKESQDARVFSEFLTRYPNGAFAEEAAAHRDRLLSGARGPADTSRTAEERAWQKVKGGQNRKGLEAFLAQFPSGVHTAEAVALLDRLVIAPAEPNAVRAAAADPVAALTTVPEKPTVPTDKPDASTDIPWRFILYDRKSINEDIRPVLRDILSKIDVKVKFAVEDAGTVNFNFDQMPVRTAFNLAIKRAGLSYSYDDASRTVTIAKP